MDTKAEVRATTKDLVDAYLAQGGEVKTGQLSQSGNGYSHRDWKRAQQGQKVATAEEIEAERNRRLELGIAQKNVNLVMQLLQGKYDREIKFDIENDRLKGFVRSKNDGREQEHERDHPVGLPLER